MKKLILAICCTITLTACAGMDEPVAAQYEKQPPLNYNMNCKQINAALTEALASLERVKAQRQIVTNSDVASFMLTLGTPNYAGTIAQKEAEDRIALLESARVSRGCK